jgi:hypothetical protein
MIIHNIIWSKVTVTCPTDKSKSTQFEDAYIDFVLEHKSLTIRHKDGSALYAKASLTELTSNSFRAIAHWWSSPIMKGKTPGKTKYIPVAIQGEF